MRVLISLTGPPIDHNTPNCTKPNTPMNTIILPHPIAGLRSGASGPAAYASPPDRSGSFNRPSTVRCLFLMALVAALGAASVPPACAQFTFQTIKSFGFPAQTGIYPTARLIQGSDGVLYGTTSLGSTGGYGTVFRVNKDGSGYLVLKTISGSPPYGEINGSLVAAGYNAGLVQGSDGTLYGTTYYGGTSSNGTIFKIDTDGSGYAILRSFTGTAGDGANPMAEVIQGTDGALYGTTYGGGASGLGTVFKISTDGSGYAVLRSFTGTAGDGAVPYQEAGLVQGSDGALYGTTFYGGNGGDGTGSSGLGTLFKINTDGSGYAVLRSFTGAPGDGANPSTGLVQGRDGSLYGTTQNGGSGDGTVFKLNTDGSGYTVLRKFSGDGAHPESRLIQGTNGMLFGTTFLGGVGNGTVFGISTNGSSYAVLKALTGPASDGKWPIGLTLGNDGELYVTSVRGGADNSGAISRLKTDGTAYTLLLNLSDSGGDGYYLSVSAHLQADFRLAQGSDGSLYGTTPDGGTNSYNAGGAVYRLNRSSYSILHSFNNSSGGFAPMGGVLLGGDGVLYGTTQSGGSHNYGTVFKLNTDGTGFVVLRSFTGTSGDGAAPSACLVEDSGGVLYGTTEGGGTTRFGTVFKLSTSGSGYQVIHSFADGTTFGSLMLGADGALYGTTAGGGQQGAVFKMNTDGSGYTILHNFTGTGGDGAGPSAGLVQGRDGTLYGTTEVGGSGSFGGGGGERSSS